MLSLHPWISWFIVFVWGATFSGAQWLIPGSVLKVYSWQAVEVYSRSLLRTSYIGCWGLNLGWSCAMQVPSLLYYFSGPETLKWNMICQLSILSSCARMELAIDVCALPLRLILGPKHYEHLAETRAPSWLSWAQGKGFFMYQGKGLLHVMSFPEESQHTVKPTWCKYVLLQWHIFGGGILGLRNPDCVQTTPRPQSGDTELR